MERKNTVLLTVIAVATLLVAVVGATFAYFTATTAETKGTGNVNVNTQNVNGGTDFKFTAEAGKDHLKFPGGIAIIAAKATGDKASDNETGNLYDFSYQLKIASSGAIGTPLNWRLYEKKAAAGADLAAVDACSVVTDVQPLAEGKQETRYYYTKNGQKDGGDCTLSAFTDLSTALGSPIAQGTITGANVAVTSGGTKSDTAVVSDKRTISTTAGAAGTAYYYLVIEYPNDSSSQNTADSGKAINVSLTIAGDITTSIKGTF